MTKKATSPPLTPSPDPPFTVPDDLVWEPVLTEPEIAQPVFMSFDERGRLWVAEYRQYPYPAGLKMLSKDSHWRAVYDKVPVAPPNHERGADRISIHEDTDGDGTFDKHKTFVEGLSIATSFARGRGGVWVLNPPYLLFYPDANNDDVPDSDPKVHLEGFGIEDTHSCANSLTFGPDGWLYGCQGSTVSGRIVRPGTDDKPVVTMGQLIWRYHPEQKLYEVFAEGGGNAFGLEIDANGQLYSGHNGGDTRGFHYVQGGYYRKGFEKHGALSNPHAYGFYEPMYHGKVPRFTHDFVIYEGDALPAKYRGMLFGVEPLQGQVTLTEITPNGSTFKTRDLDRVVRSEGDTFRPVNIATGPDGAIYVADFRERYIAHRDHFEGRIEKETGRVYRLRFAESGDGKTLVEEKKSANDATASPDLPSPDPLALLSHANRWHRQTAVRLIGDRQDASLIPKLRSRLLTTSDPERSPVDFLWALYQLGGLDDPTTLKLLEHPDSAVREWTVRLNGDDREVSPQVGKRLAELARSESDIHVLVQLACTARRLDAETCLAIVDGLLQHDDATSDPLLPLSIWWAVEAHCDENAPAIAAMFTQSDVWSRKLALDVFAERLMRRFASGNRSQLALCADLLKAAPNDAVRKPMLAGFELAFRGRSAAALPDELVAAISESGGLPLSLRIRRGEPEAVATAIEKVADAAVPAIERIELAALLGESRSPEALPVLLKLFDSSDAKLRQAGLAAFAGYDEDIVGDALLTALSKRPPAEQVAIASVLVSRADWTRRLVERIESGEVSPDAVPADLVRRLTLHNNASLTAAATKLWPELAERETSSGRDVESLTKTIVADNGDPYTGRRLFLEACGRCHKLFGEGGEVGPDLTSDPRNDLNRLLGSIVKPSAEIREGFETWVAVTSEGRVISGLLVDQDEHVVVIRESDGRAVLLHRDEIEDLVRQPQSLMPDRLLDNLTDQEIRDMFAYLRSSQPLNDAR